MPVRKPVMVYINDQLEVMAKALLAPRPEDMPLLCRDKLDTRLLDFSMDSLKAVDLYLQAVREYRLELEPGAFEQVHMYDNPDDWNLMVLDEGNSAYLFAVSVV